MVDLRLVQVGYGSWYHWWQVIANISQTKFLFHIHRRELLSSIVQPHTFPDGCVGTSYHAERRDVLGIIYSSSASSTLHYLILPNLFLFSLQVYYIYRLSDVCF